MVAKNAILKFFLLIFMNSTFIFHSPAKINLDLKVIDKKPDGYHLIESNFQILSFFDEIEVN